jgi:hypothetical protein
MKVIAIAHRSQEHTPEDFAPHLEAESHRALEMFAEQSVRELYSRTDGKGAIVVLEVETEEEAREKLESLPLAKLGMLSFEIYGTQPYRGFITNL